MRHIAAIPAYPIRALDAAEHFLAKRAFERVPWLAVAIGLGIAVWFAWLAPEQWIAILFGCAAAVVAGLAIDHGSGGTPGQYPHLAAALIGLGQMIAAGRQRSGRSRTCSARNRWRAAGSAG